MKPVIVILTLSLVGCAVVAAHWAVENATLQAQLKRVELRLEQHLELAMVEHDQSAQLVLPKASCEPNQPFTRSTLEELCVGYIEEGTSSVKSLVVETAPVTMEKYATLLAQLTLNKEEQSSVSELLKQREALLNAPLYGYFVDEAELNNQLVQQQQQLVELDLELQHLLDDEMFSTYQLLKDSEYEQYQLHEFEESLSEPLQIQQRSSLLMAKLEAKQGFEQQLANLNDEGVLSQGELRAAVERYKASYYMESAALLHESAYHNLRAYEDAQFEALYQSLAGQVLDP